ncbi:hypothetical protein SDC9_184452 [bioreactor metagenome]|uniref:Uncharacterized protein n=1 Tax=bioreactor metagenome TaxID=1076179 RepID=A0A645HDZ5_9ZZZZ
MHGKFFDLFFVHFDEPVHHRNFGGDCEIHLERIVFIERGFARIHRVDDVIFDRLELVSRHAFDEINFCKTHIRAFLARQQLHALRRAVCALVVLAGQIFHSKHTIAFFVRHILTRHRIDRRFAEHICDRGLKILIVNTFHVVAVQNPHLRDRYAKVLLKICGARLRFHIKALFLFYK